MKPAEAADELRTLTALFIANPRRIVALEMAIKRLNDDALDPAERAKKVFKALTPEQRESVTEGSCNCCWAASGGCKCLDDDDKPAE